MKKLLWKTIVNMLMIYTVIGMTSAVITLNVAPSFELFGFAFVALGALSSFPSLLVSLIFAYLTLD